MAIVCALISGTFSFLFSLVWTLINGGSVAGFFLTYFLLGNALFVALLGYGHLAATIQRRRHSRAFRSRLRARRPV